MKEQNHPNAIKIRNAHVHNLKHTDMDIPLIRREPARLVAERDL